MLSLFPQDHEPKNLLPFDGEALYWPSILSKNEAAHFLRALQANIPWENEKVKLFGKTIECKRQTAWMGEENYVYTYSGMSKTAILFDNLTMALKERIEKFAGIQFNACLLNYYKNGSEAMSWHSDNEASMGKLPIIASLSIGAERKFAFKHQNNQTKVSLLLENGSLLLMRGETQTYWKHCLPASKLITSPRINLSFRQFIPS